MSDTRMRFFGNLHPAVSRAYFVKAGEVIEWNYTCDLGCDLENGDPYGYGKEWKDNHD